jgi:hypothetical protein
MTHYSWSRTIFAAVALLCGSSVMAKNLDENQALDQLIETTQHDGLYKSWARPECLSYITESRNRQYFDFAIREKHGAGCPGDPNSAPIVDRFRVYRQKHLIRWYNVVEDTYMSYENVKKARKARNGK